MTTTWRTKKLIPLAAAVLGLFSLTPAASAESNCKEAKGNLVDIYSGGPTTSGTLTNGGWLNGTTLTVYSPAFVITPNPNVVAYTGEMTISTNQGQLKIANVYLYNFVTGQGTALGNIDPAASTGMFAGAKGVIFLNLTATTGSGPVNYLESVSGQVCFAKQ
jgi:hypothetical protein